ncbi:MAG: hypothetical protein K2J70_04035 [Muribaculaceae bacterium]|nr:hypothetical protein [Muribaculaceae bacterium]
MDKKIYKLAAVMALVLTFLCGCEKELDFKYNDIDPIPVIEGSLTQHGAEVSLTLTTPMDEPMRRERLTDAEVSILDLTTGEEIMLTIDAEGFYVSPQGGLEGHTYRLIVKRGGELYTSDCEMRPAVEITGMEFSWIKMPYDYVAVLQVSFTDNPATVNDCYWMRLYRNGAAYQWAELNDIHASGGVIDKVVMTTRRDLEEEDEADRLEKGDVVTATIVPVSRAMHDYLEALAVGNSNGPRMFTGGFCLGYFLAAPIAERTLIFDPDSF